MAGVLQKVYIAKLNAPKKQGFSMRAGNTPTMLVELPLAPVRFLANEAYNPRPPLDMHGGEHESVLVITLSGVRPDS